MKYTVKLSSKVHYNVYKAVDNIAISYDLTDEAILAFLNDNDIHTFYKHYTAFLNDGNTYGRCLSLWDQVLVNHTDMICKMYVTAATGQHAINLQDAYYLALYLHYNGLKDDANLQMAKTMHAQQLIAVIETELKQGNADYTLNDEEKSLLKYLNNNLRLSAKKYAELNSNKNILKKLSLATYEVLAPYNTHRISM